jgi:3-dehydroquinate synthase
MNSFSSDLYFQEKISSANLPTRENLLIVDKAVLPFLPADFLQAFSFTYPVDGGENLKELENFPTHLKNILEIWNTTVSRDHTIVAMGGGSVGDFAGFVASVLKRGVKLIHCPSTWLAAIDSAHGGKTALNVQSFKNQIGTFYPAEKVFIFKELLLRQPAERALEGLGEMVKMALIEHPSFIFELVEREGEAMEQVLWRHLEKTVAAKYKIVLQDPYETKGLRKILNLGHTLGHVIEVGTKCAHGAAVTQGLLFALEWSRERAGLSEGNCQNIISVMDKLNLKKSPTPLAQSSLRASLAKDKKMGPESQLDFIFVRAPGDVVAQKVSIDEITREALRQGWCQ